MVALEALLLIQAHRAQSAAKGCASRSEDSACHEHLNMSPEALFEKSGANGAKARIICSGRHFAPRIERMGDERTPYPLRSKMASMRRLALSSRQGSYDCPRRTLTTFAPLMLASIRTLGGRFLTTRCMMSFVRTRVLQSKVRSLLRTKAICAVTSKPGTSGATRWIPSGRLSLTAMRRISVGWSP
jgi:hypothetical protein